LSLLIEDNPSNKFSNDMSRDETILWKLERKMEPIYVYINRHRKQLSQLEKNLQNHILSNIKPACYNSDDD